MIDIQSIINKINDSGNLTPEQTEAVMTAIGAILKSRIPPLAGNSSAGLPSTTGGNPEVEIDPELLQPSKKFKSEKTDDSIEIDDPDNVLSQIKTHDSDETEIDDEESNSEDESNDNDVDSSSDNDTTENENNSNESETTGQDSTGETDTDSDNLDDSDLDDSDMSDNDDSNDSDDSEDFDEIDQDDNESEEDTLPDDEEELQDKVDLQDIRDKGFTPRKIAETQKQRAIELGKQVLSSVPETDENKKILDKIKSAVEKLENLSEEDLENISDEEFDNLINTIIDAAKALKNDITVKSAEEVKATIKEIQKEFEDPEVAQELENEDNIGIWKEKRIAAASERTKTGYRPRNFKSIADFKINFYKAIKDQVEEVEEDEETWSAINRRHDGTDRIAPGYRGEPKPNSKIPTVDVYMDCSGSWNDEDIKIGEELLSLVLNFERQKKLKINLYYFSNNVWNTKQDARREGGTRAWPYILSQIKASKTKNVVIITDSDMNYYARGGASLKIEGCMWWIWKNGDSAPECTKHLIGKRGNFQYSFISE